VDAKNEERTANTLSAQLAPMPVLLIPPQQQQQQEQQEEQHQHQQQHQLSGECVNGISGSSARRLRASKVQPRNLDDPMAKQWWVRVERVNVPSVREVAMRVILRCN
jgi:hypothetical protein